MNAFARSFMQGLLVLVPVVVTGWVVWLVVRTLDGIIETSIPGLGVLLAGALITLIGFLASNVVGRKIFEALEQAITRLPVVKLLYGSLRDLLNAFVGDKRSFDQPVMVELMPGTGIKVLGFVTCTEFDDPQLADHVGVYLPQSYNFAGNLIVVPRDRVQPVDADSAQFLAFVVSGGVATMNASRTVADDGFLERLPGGRASL